MPLGTEERAWTYSEYVEKYDTLRTENANLKSAIDGVAIHTFHMLWILDSDKWPELKEFFDAGPRGLLQHVGEIQKCCAEAGSKIAQTGKIE